MRLMPWIAIVGTVGVAAGQAFNVDFGKSSFQAEFPSASYGGAANQPGFWNGDFAGFVPLKDLSGSSTAAFLSSGVGSVQAPISIPVTDETRLMGDAARGATFASQEGLQVVNLTPGEYRIYVYGWAGSVEGNDDNKILVVNFGSSTSSLLTINYAAQWPGHQILGETYATWDFTIASANTSLGIYPQNRGTDIHPRFSYVNGIQIVPIPAPGAMVLPLAALLVSRRRR